MAEISSSLFSRTSLTGSDYKCKDNTLIKKTGKGLLKGLETVGDFFTIPQKGLTYLASGASYLSGTRLRKPEFEYPGKAMGLTGWRGMVADVIMDPIWFIGAPGLAIKSLRLGKEYSEIIKVTSKTQGAIGDASYASKLAKRQMLGQEAGAAALELSTMKAKTIEIASQSRSGFSWLLPPAMETVGPGVSGKLADTPFFQSLGKLMEQAKPVIVKKYEKAGYKSISPESGDILVRTRSGAELTKEHLKTLKLARESGTLREGMRLQELGDVHVVYIHPEVRQFSIQALNQYHKTGALPSWFTLTGSEAKLFSKTTHFIDSVIDIGIPFTDIRMGIGSMEKVRKGFSSFNQTLKEIPGFGQAYEALGKVGTKASSLFDRAVDYKTMAKAEKGLIQLTERVKEKAPMIIEKTNQVIKEFYETMRQLNKQGAFDEVSEEIFSIAKASDMMNDARILGKTKEFSEMLKGINSNLADNYIKMNEAFDYFQKLVGQVSPELKGFMQGQPITEEAFKYFSSKPSKARGAGWSEFAKDVMEHREWFKYVNPVSKEIYWGKASDKGLEIIKTSEIEKFLLANEKKVAEQMKILGGEDYEKLIKAALDAGYDAEKLMAKGLTAETKKEIKDMALAAYKKNSKVIDAIRIKVQNPKFNTYANRKVMEKLEKGELSLTELDRNLWEAWIEKPEVLNREARKRLRKKGIEVGDDFRMFEENHLKIKTIDAAVQAEIVSSEALADRLLGSSYIQKATKSSPPPEGWVEVGFLTKSRHAEKGATYYAAPGNAAWLNKLNGTVFRNAGLQGVYDTVRKATSWWKSWTLGIFPAYHFRNHFDDGFRAAITTDMGLIESFISPFFSIGGQPSAISLLRQFKKGTLSKDVKIGQYSAHEIMYMAQDNGILSDAMTKADTFDDFVPSVDFSLLKPGEKVTKLTKQLGRDNVAVKYGFEVGTYLESSRRLNLFIHELKAGKSPAEAATIVRAVLFNYNELTDFEKGSFPGGRQRGQYCLPSLLPCRRAGGIHASVCAQRIHTGGPDHSRTRRYHPFLREVRGNIFSGSTLNFRDVQGLQKGENRPLAQAQADNERGGHP